MDLKLYFQRVRDVERSIDGDYAVVVSLDTPEGGRSGVMTEVTKAVAGRLVADGKARLAHPDETHDFYLKLKRERDEMLAIESDDRPTWPPAPGSIAPQNKSKRRPPKKEGE